MIARLFARFREARDRRALARRVAALTEPQRRAILDASLFETYTEQGMEGSAYVIAKNEKDFGAALGAGPGIYFPSVHAAENWIIARDIERER